MLKVSLTIPVCNQESIESAICKKIGAKKIKNYSIVKKSIDARKKDCIKYNYTVIFEVDNERKYLRDGITIADINIRTLEDMCIGRSINGKVAVIGTGPAGLFCALTLAYMGAKPIVFERGESVENRQKSVNNFFQTLSINTESNVQFGEGGAGTFSDGKLNTNLHNEYVGVVLQEFVKHGAPEEITYLNKPHIGTDNLLKVVKNMRNKIIELGGEVRFNEKLTDLILDGNNIKGIITNLNKYDFDKVYLGIGHSARDTFEMLYRKGVVMVPKTYSMGVRIEHLRTDINFAQYGKSAPFIKETADYKLSCNLGERSLYTFCMCPGGKVINASSEDGGICVNGMSNYSRMDDNSNSALLVNVSEKDFGSDHPLSGVEFQRKYERRAYNISNSFRPIVQLYGDFCQGKISNNYGKITPSVESGFCYGDINSCLPSSVANTIKLGVKEFGKKLKGFDDYESVLTGIETRSSSPVRILRDENYNSSIIGLHPIGEGAGYAGGIVSAAIDGIKSVLLS